MLAIAIAVWLKVLETHVEMVLLFHTTYVGCVSFPSWFHLQAPAQFGAFGSGKKHGLRRFGIASNSLVMTQTFEV
jgi:hypothetical protein